MNDQPTEPPQPPPAQPPQQPGAAQPPAQPVAGQPAPGQARPQQAGAPMRLLVIILSVLLGFGGAVMVIVGLEVNDLASCDDLAGVVASGESECFDGSGGIKPVVVGISIASGVLAAIGLVVGLFFAVTGTRGRLFAQVAVAAAVLAAVALIL